MRSILATAWFPGALFSALLLHSGLSLAGKDLTLQELPAAVRTTVERETKGGQITDIEQDDEKGQVIYEVEFTLEGKRYEIDVAADGKLLKRHQD